MYRERIISYVVKEANIFYTIIINRTVLLIYAFMQTIKSFKKNFVCPKNNGIIFLQFIEIGFNHHGNRYTFEV